MDNSDSSQDDAGPIWPHGKEKYDDMNSKIMLGAVISLSIVITIVVILHIYARCMMRRNQSRMREGGASVHQLPLQVTSQVADQPKTGLEPSVIASLPLVIIKDHNPNNDDQENEDKMSDFDCAVCLSSLETGETARLLPNCKHSFHVECIDMWLENQTNCPICRTEVAPFIASPLDGATEGGASGSGGAKVSGSSSRLSSFRRMISRDWSSSRRIQPSFAAQDVIVQDLERQ